MSSLGRVLGGAFWVVACAASMSLGGCRGGGDVDEPEALARVSPAAVSMPGAWSLFDRSIESGFVPGSEPVRVAFDHLEQISALKVFAPAPYKLRVTGRGGSSIGFAPLDLSNLPAGWRVMPSTSLVATDAVELRFEALSATPAKLPELELWAGRVRADGSPTTDLTIDAEELSPRFVTVRPGTGFSDILPGDCESFPIVLERSPATFRRGYLVYAAEGLFRSFSLTRTVNGIGAYGGKWLAGDATKKSFVDELDPSALQLGANEIELCVPADASRGVAITGLRFIGELDQGTELAVRASLGDAQQDAKGLLDRDPDTQLEIAAGERLELALERFISPDLVSLSGRALDAATDIDVQCIDKSATSTLSSVARGTPTGLAVKLDASASSCSALALTFDRTVTLTGVDVLGSGTAEAVDWPDLVVTSAPEHFGDVGWVGGFVRRPSSMAGATHVDIAGTPADAMTGNFGRLLTRTGDVRAPWPVSVAVRLPSGTTQTRQIVLDRDLAAKRSVVDATAPVSPALAVPSPDAKYGREGDSVVVTTAKLEATKIRLGTSVGVDIPVGALVKPTPISVKHLRDSRISVPGNPRTLMIESNAVVAATVRRLLVRTPTGEGGFAVKAINGEAAIRAFLGK